MTDKPASFLTADAMVELQRRRATEGAPEPHVLERLAGGMRGDVRQEPERREKKPRRRAMTEAIGLCEGPPS